MRVLPHVRVQGRDYFLDARLGELRNVRCPWDVVPLNEAEIEYYKALAEGAG